MKAAHLLFIALASVACLPAWSQVITKPVTLVVGYSPGGPTDQYARTLAPKLSAALGVPVIIDNRTGANGSIAISQIAKAKPDGTTIGLMTSAQGVINPQMLPRGGGVDTFKDLTFLASLVRYENILLIGASQPMKSLQELVTYAKANPGKISFGSGGNGASNHLSSVLLEMATGTKLNHIPYRGSAPALVDVIGGNVTMMFDVLATGLPHVQTGKVRALVVTGAKRSPFAPDVPTFAEAGYPEYERLSGGLWFTMVAPAHLPPEVLSALRAAFDKVKNDPDVKAKIVDLKYDAWDLKPEDFPEFYQSEYRKWGAAIKASGAKLE